jgi:hypothetical protein
VVSIDNTGGERGKEEELIYTTCGGKCATLTFSQNLSRITGELETSVRA